MQPFSLARPTPALGRIEPYLLPRSSAEGIARLAAWCDRSLILVLYQELFPDAFAASTASLVAEDGRAYSPRECEFFHLTATHLFPFPEDDFRLLRERSQQFWLPFLGIDHENLQSLALLRPSWQLIYVFMLIDVYGHDEDDLEIWIEELTYGAQLGPLLRVGAGRGGDCSRFLATCRERRAPLCYVSDMYAVCAQETGNVFYKPDDRDAAGEDDWRSTPLRFTRACFEQVARDWTEAQIIEAHCEEIATWLDHPRNALRLARLWMKHA